MRPRLGRFVVGATLVASCATAPRATRSVARAPTTLSILCSLPQTRLYLDGQLVLERCGPEGIRVATTLGAHRLEARHEGYFAELRDLEVTSTGKPVEVLLRKVPALVAAELEADAPP